TPRARSARHPDGRSVLRRGPGPIADGVPPLPGPAPPLLPAPITRPAQGGEPGLGVAATAAGRPRGNRRRVACRLRRGGPGRGAPRRGLLAGRGRGREDRRRPQRPSRGRSRLDPAGGADRSPDRGQGPGPPFPAGRTVPVAPPSEAARPPRTAGPVYIPVNARQSGAEAGGARRPETVRPREAGGGGGAVVVRERSGRVLAANLRALREKAGLSLSELARRSDIAKGTLSQLESGSGNPTLETVFSLSNALEVPVSSLLAEHGDPDAVLVRSADVEEFSGDAVDLRMLRRLDLSD